MIRRSAQITTTLLTLTAAALSAAAMVAAAASAASAASLASAVPASRTSTPATSTTTRPLTAATMPSYLSPIERAEFQIARGRYEIALQMLEDQPATDPSATSQPAANRAATNQPTTSQPTTNRGATDRAATNRSATNQGGTDQPATDPSATRQPAANRATTNRAATNRGATDRAATNRSATNQGGTDQPATDPSATRQPATNRATMNQAATDRIAVARGSAWAGLGRWTQAHQAVSSVTVASAYRGQATAIAAEALWQWGKTAESFQLCRDYLQVHTADLPARAALGELLERSGQMDQAARVYAALTEGENSWLRQVLHNDESIFKSPADAVRLGVMLDRWAVLTGAYPTNRPLHDRILAIFVRVYDQIDRDLWPAHRAAAEFFLSHDDYPSARGECAAVLQTNPRDARTLQLLGRMELERLNFAAVRQIAAQLRATHPVEADLLLARVHLWQGERQKAQAILEPLLQARGWDVRVAALAAAHAAGGDSPEQAKALLGHVATLAPRCNGGLLEVGQALFTRHDPAGAIAPLRQAAELRPLEARPRQLLGSALLEDGREAEARRQFQTAYALDPFHVKTVNALRLLDMMDKFARYQTEHFTYQFDPRDAVVARYVLAPALEQSYGQLQRAFAYQPPFQTQVEMFPDLESFSVRTAGMPGLETYGASLGKVLTVISPRGGRTLGPFHLRRVLTHELTHTFNLTQTSGRVPRWLTEGLAVWSEQVPYRFSWVPAEMAQRTLDGSLFTLDQLPDALLHPRKPRDGEVAYMVGFWFVEYMLKTHGSASLQTALAAFARGADTGSALQEATGFAPAPLQAAFTQYCQNKVSQWGYDPTSQKRFDELLATTEILTRQGNWPEAHQAWLDAALIQPLNDLPQRRLAGIELKLKRPALAAERMKQFAFLELEDNRYAKAIAAAARDEGDLPLAAHWALEAIYTNPFDKAAHELMLSLCVQMRDDAGAQRQRTVLGLLQAP